MGVLHDYVAADDDDQAAGVVDRFGGPAGPATAPTRRALFRRPAPVRALTGIVFDTVPDTGIDPSVELGTLEALLTGRPHDEVVADPRWGSVLAERDDGALQVFTLTDTLFRALAAADEAGLAAVAAPWSRTDEFSGAADPGSPAEVLHQVAGLSRRAADRGRRIYCWSSL